MYIEYAPQDIDGRMVCVGNVTEDRSTSELVVTRIPVAGGEPEDVLHLPLGYLGYDLSRATYLRAWAPASCGSKTQFPNGTTRSKCGVV